MGAQSTLVDEINNTLHQLQNLTESPQDTTLANSMFTAVHLKAKKALTFTQNASLVDTTTDERKVLKLSYKNGHFANLITKSGHYFIDNPTDGVTGLPENNESKGFMFAWINPITNIHLFQFQSLTTNYSYNLLVDMDLPLPEAGDEEWAAAGGATDVGASEASTYQFLLASSSFEDCYFDILSDEDTITATATFERQTSEFSGVIGNTLISPNIIESGSYSVFFLEHIQTGTALTEEYSIDGGTEWITIPEDGLVNLDTVTSDFRVKFTWAADDSIISSFGVLYNETGVTYFSNTKLFEKYEVIADTSAPFVMSLPNDKYYTNDGKSLQVFRNRLRMWEGIDYNEYSKSSIEWLSDLKAGDSIIFEEQYGYVDISQDNADKMIKLEKNYITKTSGYTASASDFIFASTSSGIFTIDLPSSPVIGDTVIVQDISGTFDTQNLTIGRNGNTIMGIDEDLVIDIENSTTELIFSGTDWRIK